MGQKSRYTPLPDQAYDPRVTDLSKPFNVPAATGPQALPAGTLVSADGMPLPGARAGWVNRNITNTIPVQLQTGVSLRILPTNPKRTGIIIQNLDATAALNFSFSNDLAGNGAQIGAGGSVLLDFTCPPDTLYLFCGTANIRALVMEFSRSGV
jgi:hypothetical protein